LSSTNNWKETIGFQNCNIVVMLLSSMDDVYDINNAHINTNIPASECGDIISNVVEPYSINRPAKCNLDHGDMVVKLPLIDDVHVDESSSGNYKVAKGLQHRKTAIKSTPWDDFHLKFILITTS
jgi:hypothetical protein